MEKCTSFTDFDSNYLY
ncbi:hypothetical protein COJ18_29525 [Bacillus cereus]|nr:hypothetical protein CN490_18120 [Bacillus cereus]PFK30260.1 hypothetical protein COJ18_29525 [Bacillus cereus]PFR14958.1 hypothetical protein COK23_27750 [Bacillus cereus]PFR46781.1 hypothetical protein COK35_23785 [Bacillus cereus]